MVKLKKEEYTVGWVCALPVPEWQASRLLFDEEHEDAALGPNVSYQYAFGQISGHNVVMGCLPDAQPGVGTAAAVASEMRILFPALRFALLVGIGGGVPSKHHDIRLGDVVVSRINKDGRHGGVVHYDYGKYIQDGEFQPIGSLNKPPPILASAIGKVRSAPPTSTSKFDEYLHSFRKWSDHAPQFSSPPKLDQLFEASYVHPAKEQTCQKCNSNRQIVRPERAGQPVRVHYGTIASGDQVIKDAGKRDLISSVYDDDVLCFEMEAAGVLDHLQCLVIRGICDYCDSHKNKIWQPYASATAAAWAKMLLENIAPTEVAKLDTVTQVSNAVAPLKTTTMLPYPRDKHFVGRETIFHQLDDLLADRDAHSRVGICGLGGIGKSEVATEYAYRLRQSQPDTSIFWIHASSRERFRNDYQSIATELRLPGFDDVKADHLGIVFDWLKSAASGRWLMILDNADSKDLTASWQGATSPGNNFNIPTYLPRKTGSAVIVTSRDTLAAFDLVGDKEQMIKLEAMTEDEAVQLFRTKTRSRDWDQVQAHRLSTMLDCIPLAIKQAAAFIMARERTTLASYLELLHQDEETLLSNSENDLRRDVNIPNSVIKTWEISFNQIKRIDEAAVKLLFRMCFLNKHDIPDSLLEKASPSRQQFDNALENLMRFSFVDAHTDKRQMLKMHRLVQQATKTWIQINQDLSAWCFESLKTVWIDYPDDEFEDWDNCRLLEPHAESVVNASLQHWLEDTDLSTTTALPSMDHVTSVRGMYETPYTPTNALMVRAELLFKQAKFAYRQARLPEATDMAQRAQRDFDLTLGESHEDTLKVGSFLAESYLKADQPQLARHLGNRTVEAQSAILGEAHPDTLVTLCTVAMAHRELGELNKAEELLSSVIRVYESELVTDEESLVMVRNDLALVYGDQGQWKKKKQLEGANLRVLKSRRGYQHPDTLGVQHNLAISLQNLGRYQEAVTLFAQVIEGRRKVFRDNHPGTLISMGHLADVYLCQGHQSDAYCLQQQILDRFQEVNLAETHPMVLKCMSDVALYHHNRNRLQDSCRLQQKAVDLHRIILTNDQVGKPVRQERHEQSLVCQERLAKVFWAMGRGREARATLQACVNDRRRHLGHDHPSVIRGLDLLKRWEFRTTPSPDILRVILRVRDQLCAPIPALGKDNKESVRIHVRDTIHRVTRAWTHVDNQTTSDLSNSLSAANSASVEQNVDADEEDELAVPNAFEWAEPGTERDAVSRQDSEGGSSGPSTYRDISKS